MRGRRCSCPRTSRGSPRGSARGLIADSERPGIYTNGRQRWLLSSNIDTQRLFDEEVDQLGFQLKEWNWNAGPLRPALRTSPPGAPSRPDRPFPERADGQRQTASAAPRALRSRTRRATASWGRWVAHAVEATMRTIRRGETEQEIAGQLGHRLIHHNIDPVSLSVIADDRGSKFRRARVHVGPGDPHLHHPGHRTARRSVRHRRPRDRFRRFRRLPRVAHTGR